MKAIGVWLPVLLVAIVAGTAAHAQTNASAAAPAAPPSAPAKRSAADLEKLAAPIALYPDPLIAIVLPASAYPLEIVQAARFVRDTNNLARLDRQPWDANVKAVARYPDALNQMDQNIAWTSDLGDAFINQPKELMDAIQTMRSKAQESGALKTSPEQVVTVTNTVVTNVVEQQTVYVTNQVVQIEPAQPNVIYVPQYNPTVVYAGYPAYPGYYYYPAPGAVAAASVVSFGAGMAMGAWLANDCDWGHGGCWNSDVNIHRDVNVNQNFNRNVNQNINRSGNAQNRQKWQPDQNRLKNSGSTMSSAQTREARGWGSSGQAGTGAARTPTGTATGQARSAAAQNRAASTPSANRSATPNASRPASQPASTRSTAGATAAPRNTSTFSGMNNGAAERSASQRGAASRSYSGGAPRASGGAARTGGGAARGGGGGRGGGRR